MSDVSFKIVLQHTQRRQTMHRFRGDFEYPQLMELMSYLWGGKKKLVVEYTDEDGDNITVLTDVEWKECVRLHLERQEREGQKLPLSLRVCKVVAVSKKPHRKTSEGASPNVSTDAATIPTDGAALRRDEDDLSDSDGHEYVALSTNDGSMIKGSVASRCSEPPQEERAASGIPRLHLSAINRGSKGAPCFVEAENEQDGAVLHLLSILFDCDAATALFSGSHGASFGALVQRRVTATGEVHLDVDLASLRQTIVVKANQWMDAQATKSRCLLEAAVPLFRDYSPITYNLACACAIEGNADAAITWLDEALACGSYSYRQIMEDDDLTRLHNQPAFAALLRKYFPMEAAPASTSDAPSTTTEGQAEDAAVEDPSTAAEGFTLVNQPSVDEAPAAPVTATTTAPADTQAPPTPAAVAQVASTVQQLPPPAFTPRTNTMVSIFPGMSGPEAQRLLQLANGNMNLAVQWKLGTM